MPRPIAVTIHLHALTRNLGVARRHAGAARTFAVLKANAYGHGLARAAAAFAAADGFAVLDLDEAVRLREGAHGHDGRPVLMLEGFFEPRDLDEVSANGITVCVHAEEQVAMLRSARLHRPIDVFLKMNSGMNRLGIAAGRYVEVYRTLATLPAVRSVGLMTHFADADGPTGVAAQLERFNAITHGLPGRRTVANSATVLAHPQCVFDWVRPGIMLYGCSPFADRTAAALGLAPAMTLSSAIIGVQALAAGDRVGYAGTFVADRDMRIGIVACGYADGYPRHAPSGTPVLVDGVRTTTCGRVSMDMLAVDLTHQPAAQVGSAVTLWGEGLPADEVATAAGTISYELLCAVAPRVPVRIVD